MGQVMFKHDGCGTIFASISDICGENGNRIVKCPECLAWVDATTGSKAYLEHLRDLVHGDGKVEEKKNV